MIVRAVGIAADLGRDDMQAVASIADDEDAGLLDAGDNFIERMTVFGDARSRIINAVVDFYATGIKEMEQGPRGEGMVAVRDEMTRRTDVRTASS